MSTYMLGTDTVSHFLRGKSRSLDERIVGTPVEQLCVSAVTRGELLYGLQLKDGAHRLAQAIEQFLSRVQCLPWDEEAATHFAEVAAQLHKAGTPIGSMDAMIAGHAIAVQAVLITNHTRHFQRVAKLQVENWVVPA